MSHVRWSVEPNASDLGIALGRLTDLYNSALDRAAALRELYRAAVFTGAPRAPMSATSGELWGRLGEALELLRTLDENSWSQAELGPSECVLPSAAAAEGQSYREQAAALRRSPGLNLEAGLRTDFGDEPIEDGLPGAYLGLSMEFLQSGFFENRKLGEVFRLRAEAAAVRATIDRIARTNQCRVQMSDASMVPLTRTLLEEKSAVMNELEENPEVLLEAYLDVVVRARVAAGPSVPLSVSVPIWWPPAIYRRLDQTVDRFYLMAYGQAQAAALAERLRRSVAGIDPEKLVLVLRPSDFRSEWEMDSVYTAVSDAAGIRSGAVHDLAGYLAPEPVNDNGTLYGIN